MKFSPLVRFVLFLPVLFAIWKNEPAFAQDFIIGTVVSADIGKMEIEILPDLPDSSDAAEETKKSIQARLSPDSLILNGRGERVFPGCVYPGGTIRLWGQMDEGVFIVTDIRGTGGRGRSDPTGVRRRLQRMGPGYCPGGPGFHGGRE